MSPSHATDMHSIIATRRDRGVHTPEDMQFLAMSAAQASVPDYQLAAWLMAAYLNPLTRAETAALTVAMANTGARVNLDGLPKPWVDKHSTGGVGDKTTLVILPMLAACGITVVKMSGRGLGITGGTVDKLESIPGFRMDLSPDEMKDQAELIGIAITGQSPNLAPADKALYAIRDATATTENIPLIVSSILSKKIAGPEYLSLDVKCGSGAFMKTYGDAKELAIWLKDIGEQCGLRTHAAITDMDQPLGHAVGNILEVKEALSVLSGAELPSTSRRFRDLCVTLCGETLHFVDKADTREKGLELAEKVLTSGAAYQKCIEWFHAQGASREVIDAPETTLPVAPVQFEVSASVDGYIRKLNAGIVGEAVVSLGGGRKRKEDRINPMVGVVVHKNVGDQVSEEEPILTIHAASQAAAEVAAEALKAAVEIAEAKVQPVPVVFESL